MTIRQFFYNLREVQPVKVELAENEYRKLEEQVNGALPAEHISGGSSSVQTVPPVLIQYETAKENYEREKKKYEKMLKKAETYIEELKNPIRHTIMRQRYLLNWAWHTIEVTNNFKYYRTMMRIHKSALDEISKRHKEVSF